MKRSMIFYFLSPALLAGGLFVSAAQAAQAARAAEKAAPEPFIWIEGEAASRTNLPALEENPYRPKEFWEADVLSDGKWIGMKWDKPGEGEPFLEYDFEVPEAGHWFLYARKFSTFGNFRWRVDKGAWQEVPATLHRALETVPFREDDEQVYLSWFAMGGVDLPPGKHTLRIEPVFPKATTRRNEFEPLGYDVFLFTREPFFPAGKNRPGEMTVVQTAEAFSPVLPTDPFLESAIDLRKLNEARSGEKGGIEIRDGKFVFRNTGETVRLVGLNAGVDTFSDPAAIRYSIRRMAKLGFNLLRIDLAGIFRVESADGKPRLVAQPALLERFLEILRAMEEEGMYLALTWNFGVTTGVNAALLPEALRPAAMDPKPAPSVMPWLLFDPTVQAIVMEGWKTALELPLHERQPLGKSPLLAFVTLLQQESIFSDSVPDEMHWTPPMRDKAAADFQAWLAKQGHGVETLPGRWQKPEEKILRGDGRGVVVPSLPEIARERDARAVDAAGFLAEVQAGYVRKLKSFLREKLGYAGIISTGNKSLDDPSVFGWAHDWALRDREVMERLGNFLPFFEGARSPWLLTPGSRYQNRSAIALDPLPGRERFAWYDQPLRHLARPGLPSFFSEIGWPLPNRFRTELPLLATTLASLQGVDAIALNFISFPNWQSSETINRNALFTMGILGQMPAFAFAYREGLLPEGPVVARVALSEKTVFSLQPTPVLENANSQLTASLPGPRVAAGDSPIAPALWATGRVEVALGAEEDSVRVEGASVPGDELVSTDDGSVIWDHGAGIFQVRAPSVQAVGGFLAKAGKINLGDLEVESSMEFGVVCAVALDGQPLAFSRKILLQVFSEESNTGVYSEGGPLRVIRSTGRPPILSRTLKGTVELMRPDAGDFVLTALDNNGYRQVPAAVGRRLTLLPSTFYYLLEK